MINEDKTRFVRGCGQIVPHHLLPSSTSLSFLTLFLPYFCFSVHVSRRKVGKVETAAGDTSVTITHTQPEQMEQHGVSGRLLCWWSDWTQYPLPPSLQHHQPSFAALNAHTHTRTLRRQWDCELHTKHLQLVFPAWVIYTSAFSLTSKNIKTHPQ